MRFSIVFALGFLAASTNAIQLNQDQVSASRRYLAALEPSLAVAGTLQEEGVDIDAMTKCFQDLHAKGLTMTKKEDRVTITQQCVFSASLNGNIDGNFGKGGEGNKGAGKGKGKGKGGGGGGNPKGRDPRAIPVDKFARLTLSGQPNADLCTRNTKLQKHDGTQQPDRCVAVDLGEIPAEDKCPSQLFVAPKNGATLRANKAIQFKVAVNNLDTGFFSDPAIEYYKFPQMLNKQGVIMGHSHITIQDIGNGKFPPSPQQFAKFQGLNDAAKNNVFTLDVPEGLPTGNYRACTISGSFAHTPVLCPKAQRGAQEDCIRFNVK